MFRQNCTIFWFYFRRRLHKRLHRRSKGTTQVTRIGTKNRILISKMIWVALILARKDLNLDRDYEKNDIFDNF